MDAVSTGVGADEKEAVAGAFRAGSHQLVGPHQADAHRVDERVVGVAVLEVELAAHGRDPNAVAVTADARDHAFEVAAGGGQRAEAQRVEERDGARTHRDHVADDAAHAGGRALVGLYRGRVVVRLDLEDRSPAFADLDRAGVLAWTLHDTGAGRGKTAEE